MPTREEILSRTKEKFPEYRDVPDDQLASALSAKYPEYASDISADPSKPQVPYASRRGMLAMGQFPQKSQLGGAFARGALETITAGTSEAGAKLSGISPQHDPNSPQFTDPYAYMTGEIAGAALPLGQIGRGVQLAKSAGSLALKQAAKTGARIGGIMGFGSGVSQEALEENPEFGKAVKGGVQSGAIGVTAGGLLGAGAAKLSQLHGTSAERIAAHIEKVLDDNADRYRKIINPGKGEITKLEIRSGKDLDDSFRLAAEEGIIINRSPENKLDTLGAIEQLGQKKSQLGDALDSAIADKPEKQFSLAAIGKKAKAGMRELFDNDLDYQKAKAQVDAEIAASQKERGGDMVDGKTLNDIKRGMWSKGYNPMEPNANKVARRIGYTAKDAIELAYKDDDIKGLNEQLGKYITLQTILEAAHGRIVDRGKLGKYVNQGAGALAGGLIGHTLGVPVLGEVGGAVIGKKVGEAIGNIAVDPERITRGMARQAQALKPQPRIPVGADINARTASQLQAAKTAMQDAEAAKQLRILQSKKQIDEAIKNGELLQQQERQQFMQEGNTVSDRFRERKKFDEIARNTALRAQRQREASALKESVYKSEAQKTTLQDAEAAKQLRLQNEQQRISQEAKSVADKAAQQADYEKTVRDLTLRASLQRQAQSLKEKVYHVVRKGDELFVENITDPRDWHGPKMPVTEESNQVLKQLADDLNHGRLNPQTGERGVPGIKILKVEKEQ